MMTNKEVAKTFNLLGKLLELHGENPFKTRSYSSAYVTIRKQPSPVIDMSKEELLDIKGIGKAIAEKIVELRETGQVSALQRYINDTPTGIVDMLGIKGFGPKKVKAVWEQLGIESAGELLYACHENRLVDLKGFGAKTQASLIEQLTYHLDSQGKYLYGHIAAEANELLELLQEEYSKHQVLMVEDVARKMPEIDGIDLLTDADTNDMLDYLQSLDEVEEIEGALHYQGTRVNIEYCDIDTIHAEAFKRSCSEDFLASFEKKYKLPTEPTTDEWWQSQGLAPIPAESRELPEVLSIAEAQDQLSLITDADIQGVVHAHSTWSDGVNSLREMAEESKRLGYEYLVISDHSKAAFYANGLNEDRVIAQMEEIDQLNAEIDDFHIYKSIECDILYDGSLDYDDDFLERFDMVISSVHSNLKMDATKATERIIAAVKHPATTILGHPTGRLLLSRQGYPVDIAQVIDACAEYGTAIEINASPYRLDLDWQWIQYAVERGVSLSINPDAHSIAGIQDIQYGVIAARKGLLQADQCLNTKTKSELDAWLVR